MKKLMILASLAATVAAFGADCNLVNNKVVCEPTGPWVYQWKFTGKTTDGVKLKDTVTKTGTLCTIGQTIVTAGEVMRVPASLAIQGYTYQCKPCCITAGYEFDKEAFVVTKPTKEAFLYNQGVMVRTGNIIGKAGKQVEMYGEFFARTSETKDFYWFSFAGFGKYDTKNLRVSSASGNFSGWKMTVHSAKYTGCPEATYWDCCVTRWLEPTQPSIAYGSWSAKYNAKASRKYAAGVVAKLPIYGTNY